MIENWQDKTDWRCGKHISYDTWYQMSFVIESLEELRALVFIQDGRLKHHFGCRVDIIEVTLDDLYLYSQIDAVTGYIS